MTEREWLIQQGLAKPGSRGRASAVARQAVAAAKAKGMIFDTKTPKPKTDKPKTPKVVIQRADVPTSSITRDFSVVWGIDKASSSNHTDLVIAFEHCGGCGKAVTRCSHETPLLPSWLGGGVALLVKP